MHYETTKDNKLILVDYENIYWREEPSPVSLSEALTDLLNYIKRLESNIEYLTSRVNEMESREK